MMNFDVVIVGGGLAGLSLAAALRRSTMSVALVEGRLPVFPEALDSRIYAISPANARFLENMGVWPHLDHGRITPVHRMAVRGDGRGELDFSAYDSGVGELAWIAESSLLHAELWESAKRQGNLALLSPATPAAINLGDAEAVLTLSDRRTLKARLIVAADGADSWTRTAAGIKVDFMHYDQMGVVANFAVAHEHRNGAWQWFRPDGVLAWLPLPGKRISMVWSTPVTHARSLLGLDAETLGERVAAAGGHRLGKLELITPAAGFPLRLMRAPRTVAHRFALIGDAAHTIHPLSGHGINLGFQDARSLAEVLGDCPGHVDCGDLRWLRRHERARREEVLALQTVTHGLHALFANTASPLSALRNLGMNCLNGLPVIKDVLVRYAMG